MLIGRVGSPPPKTEQLLCNAYALSHRLGLSLIAAFLAGESDKKWRFAKNRAPKYGVTSWGIVREPIPKKKASNSI